MNAHQRKIIYDHAKRAGHLVDLWDSRDWRWYVKNRYRRAVS